MRQESDIELLKELQHREHAHNVQTDRRIAKWTVVVSIVALFVSIIAIVVSLH